MDITPESKSKPPSAISSSVDQVPLTPKLPFDPPRRRSSLAFSKLIDSPQMSERDEHEAAADSDFPDQTPESRPIVRQARTLETPARCSGIPPGHVAQIQKVFQTARANLQFDMHFAASPIGSIDARLPSTNEETRSTPEGNSNAKGSEKSWRFSTIPGLLSTTNMDVREPVPDASSPLPAICVQQPRDTDASTPIEPPSSGFVSADGKECTNRDCSDVLQSPSEGGVPDLMEPMTGLKVGSEIHIPNDTSALHMDDSPIIDHLRRTSDVEHISYDDLPLPPDTIFLSQSAKAAAESAIAKRELLKKAVDSIASQTQNGRSGKFCPDPSAHLYTQQREGLYPDPDDMKAYPRAWGNERLAPQSSDVAQNNPFYPRRRTTATGSPMPFAKRTFNPSSNIDDVNSSRWMSSPPQRTNREVSDSLPSLTYAPQHRQKPSEHFRPGWQYPSQPVGRSTQPVVNFYSFSTAAAKATGESAAPDSRIRDSYRTDTLTPLALPPGRYRRNGLGAPLQVSRPRRQHHNPSLVPRLVSNNGSNRQRRNERPGFPDSQTRSSPPLPSTRLMFRQHNKKRSFADAGMPEFNVSEDSSMVSYEMDMRLRPSEEMMEIDDETRAAVRMSVFGPDTPEYLHGAREGIRELSPNVNIWRKGLQTAPHFRKKRRPSYWDGDLEEVKMSPAGRGGIASSPPLSKKSMVAELEVMSTRAETVTAGSNGRGEEYNESRVLTNKENTAPNLENDMDRSDAFEMEA